MTIFAIRSIVLQFLKMAFKEASEYVRAREVEMKSERVQGAKCTNHNSFRASLALSLQVKVAMGKFKLE